jgi:hypothetical protein
MNGKFGGGSLTALPIIEIQGGDVSAAFKRIGTIDREALHPRRRAHTPISIPLSSCSTSFPAPQVWQLRISIHALADAGGLLDCASLACAAALRYFRRADVRY